MKSDVPFVAYTDGACRGNPGPGGWGAVLIQNQYCTVMSGYSAQTTNNKMEMQAAIEVLSFIPANSSISITTDSQYLKQGIQGWIKNWKKNGWKLKGGGNVKNVERWQQLDQLVSERNVNWGWVKGHNGDPLNELADNLATSAITNKCGVPSNSTDPNNISQDSDVSSLTKLPRAPQKIRESQLNQKFKKVHITEFLQHHNKIETCFIYTDVACNSVIGPGGWGALIQQNGLEVELSDGEKNTSVNRMEMKAIINSVSLLPPGSVVYITARNNEYVQNGIRKWIKNWKKNGWKTAENTDVKNQDLWIKIDEIKNNYQVHWEWINDNGSHPQNERCIQLAATATPK